MKTLGILGGGQLGRLIAEAAESLGYETAALDGDKDAPALKFVDKPFVAPLTDPSSVKDIASVSDVLTLEWENIPVEVLEAAAKLKPLFPQPSVLGVIQDRLTQRDFLKKHGLPQTEYGEASPGAAYPFPVIIKRRRLGYDGKGQCVVDSAPDLPKAAEVLKAPCIYEKKVSFIKEMSVILARTRDGEMREFPVAENVHRNGILHTSFAPADISPQVADAARAWARKAAEALGHVGVMGVEMFCLKDGSLLINELAPRVHNSGHYTLGGCATSQFEQHARAVLGLPLGDVSPKGSPALMVNLLGELWSGGEPRWETLKAVPGLTLHLYGKASARPGRKMGHYTVLGEAAKAERERADERLSALRR